MAIADVVLGGTRPAKCYLYPEPVNPGAVAGNDKNIFAFQYWPQSIQISYEPNFSEKDIPGGSHPIYQWVSGRGRTISFEAIFTSEIDTSAAALSVPELTPSDSYTVNVAAALARIQSFMMPTYDGAGLNGTVQAPKRLVLVFPGVGLGGSGAGTGAGGGTTLVKFDAIRVILRNAPITIESCFPSGAPRVATVQLTFNEIVQQGAGGGRSIQFIGADRFAKLGADYKQSTGVVVAATVG